MIKRYLIMGAAMIVALHRISPFFYRAEFHPPKSLARTAVRRDELLTHQES
jgi:hypothetical protein